MVVGCEREPRRADCATEGEPGGRKVGPDKPRPAGEVSPAPNPRLSGPDEQLERPRGEKDPRLGPQGDGSAPGHRHRNGAQSPQKRGKLHRTMIAEAGGTRRRAAPQ